MPGSGDECASRWAGLHTPVNAVLTLLPAMHVHPQLSISTRALLEHVHAGVAKGWCVPDLERLPVSVRGPEGGGVRGRDVWRLLESGAYLSERGQREEQKCGRFIVWRLPGADGSLSLSSWRFRRGGHDWAHGSFAYLNAHHPHCKCTPNLQALIAGPSPALLLALFRPHTQNPYSLFAGPHCWTQPCTSSSAYGASRLLPLLEGPQRAWDGAQ